MRTRKTRSASGFTLIELCIVAAIMVIVATLAIPNLMTAVANVRLRSAANNIASVLQSTRMAAIRVNRPISAHVVTDNGATILYADTTQPYGTYQGTEPHASFVNPLGFSSTAPPEIVAVSPGFTPAAGDPSFNGHGVPVVVDPTTGAVVTGTVPSGFVLYLQQSRSLGATAYAAVVLRPSGRTNVLIWNPGTSTWN